MAYLIIRLQHARETDSITVGEVFTKPILELYSRCKNTGQINYSFADLRLLSRRLALSRVGR